MKKKLFIIISLLTLFTVFTSCSNKNETENKETIVDMVDRKVEIIPGSYQRVVCIGAGALRLYSYIGDVNKLSGVEDIDNYTLENRPKIFDSVARPYFIAYKEVFKNLPSCGVGGPQAQAAEVEKILECNPDIVISEYEDVDKENALEKQLGVPVITVRYGSKGVFDENIKKSIELLGKFFSLEDRANALNEFIDSEKSAIEARVSRIVSSNEKKVYICGLGNWGTTNHLMTVQNYEPFNVSKINNVINGLVKDGIQAIDEEKYLAISDDIDVLIIDSAAIKNITDKNVFEPLKAWKNGEVYLQMAYNAYYTNIEIALINTWYNAKVVYPSLFSDIDMTEKTNEVTKTFLGKELASEIFSYPNSFGGYKKMDTTTFPN